MPEPDWKAVLVDVRERLGQELASERKNKDLEAQQLGYAIVRSQDADTSSAVARIKQLDAKIDGLKSGYDLTSGYLNGSYVLPKST